MKKTLAAALCLLLILLSLPALADRTDFFSEEGCTVTLDYSDGAARPRAVRIASGAAMEAPAEPDRRGFDFACWADPQGQPVSFPFSPEADVTLTAQWKPAQMTVTLDSGDKNVKTQNMEVDYGSALEAPEALSRKGFSFRWWSTRPEGEAARFPITVTADLTLYAVWMEDGEQVFVVTYDPGFAGAKEIKPAEVKPGKGIKKFPDVKREGYVLDGWSLSEGGELLKAPFKPEGSCTLYAVWSAQEYTVNFSANWPDAPDGGKFIQYKVPGGTQIDMPESDPERENHTFTGWYTSAEGGSLIEFPAEVTRSTTYYAHWKHRPVATTIFDAEFTEFDPLEQYPGYSGEALGRQVIQTDAEGSFQATTQYGDGMDGPAYYVSYMYKQGAAITFVIQCDREVTGVSLYASLASESDANKDLIIASEGDYGYQFIVNGKPLSYEPLNVSHTGEPFRELLVSPDVTLHAGENVIRLVTNNQTPMGGTMKASAPTVDCIRLDNLGDAVLTWSPVYDNIR